MTDKRAEIGKPAADDARRLAGSGDEHSSGQARLRPGLSHRDRSLITVACLVALNRATELALELDAALENGVSRDELIELVAHVANYTPQIAL